MQHVAFRRQTLSVRAQGGSVSTSAPPAPAARAAAPKKPTLFAKLGGREGVEAAVDRFYNKVIADPTVSSYFSATDMKRQRAKQTAFLAYALGGAAEWKGKDMRTAHKHLAPSLNAVHFQAIAKHLRETLTELGAEAQDIENAMAVVASTKTEVLNE